jgi:hypothetical protein
MKKTQGEKAADKKTQDKNIIDQKTAAEPSSPNPGVKKIEPGKPPQRPEKKKVREAPKPFNNPFAEALKKK